MSDEKISQLASKIAKAGKDVGGKLKADSKNREQNYDYISADKILSVCGQALFENSVAVIPSITHHEIQVAETKNGKTRYDCLLDMDMTVTDGADTLHFLWAGMGSDYAVPDKALYKALTSGHKYFLMKLLNIGEGNEDGEHEPEEKPARTNGNGNGNGHKPAQPQQAKGPVETAQELGSKMSLDTAAKVTNSEGKKYIELDDDKLRMILNSIAKGLAKPDLTPEHRDELLYKRDAANTILAARQEEADHAMDDRVIDPDRP